MIMKDTARATLKAVQLNGSLLSVNSIDYNYGMNGVRCLFQKSH